MARLVLTALLTVIVTISVGCAPMNTGTSRILPNEPGTQPVEPIDVSTASETDIVEQMVVSRNAYRQGLELLVRYYTKVGHNVKLKWAQKELASLERAPRYDFIIEAGIAGEHLRASVSISPANYLFVDGQNLEKKGGMYSLFKNDNTLRLALSKYKALISKYPSSDKIDDAAYRAGCVTEYFRDYKIALVYYQRTYQWDAQTPYPARFREAHILDVQLRRRSEALTAYQRALGSVKGGEHHNWVSFAKRRVAVLTKTVVPER